MTAMRRGRRIASRAPTISAPSAGTTPAAPLILRARARPLGSLLRRLPEHLLRGKRIRPRAWGTGLEGELAFGPADSHRPPATYLVGTDHILAHECRALDALDQRLAAR